ncbi:hypothetical protein ACLF3G_18050 [Falsiroseomonas sp. HC035]|uniref:hypothetical protein n=1 Tax=Falsiroseomonas sp. HC035 TaxID=3390999 RepID=UPI003D31365F
MARDTLPASGWLPVEALDDLADRQAAASREEAERLVALPPRERVLDLMRLVASGTAEEAKLRPADLATVLASFEGPASPDAAALAAMFPTLPED